MSRFVKTLDRYRKLAADAGRLAALRLEDFGMMCDE
jgi:hypothetical protein